MKIKDIQPCDLIFYQPRKNASILSKLIAWCQWGLGEGWGSYSHCSIAGGRREDETGIRWIEYEGTHPVSRIHVISLDDLNKYVLTVYRPNIDGRAKGKILEWAEENTGVLYDYIEIITLGKINIKKWLSCSDFIYQAFKSSGVELIKKQGATASPNELIRSEKLSFVGSIEVADAIGG